MKYAFVALALAALAQAQTRDDIPKCALPCLDKAVTDNTSCKTTDYACVCKNFDAIQGSATSCVIKECGADVALNKVLPATQALCAAQGGSETSAAVTTSAAAPTTAAPTTVAGTTSVVSSAPPASTSQGSSAPATTPVGTGSPTAPPSNGTATTRPTGVPTAGAAALVPGLALLVLGALAL